jgi:acyltransferase
MSEVKLASDRVVWIDTLRAISILAIVAVHTGRMSDAFSVYITSFCMPVFFFLSGLFVKASIRQQAFLPFVGAKIRRLLLPYLTFSVISYLIWFWITGKLKGEILPTNPIGHFLLNLLFGVGGYGWLDYNIALWFFPCLFVVELLFFGLIRLPSCWLLAIALGGLSVIGYFYFQLVSAAHFRLPFGADIAITAVVFYGIGYLVQPYLLHDATNIWCSLPAIAIGLVTYIVSSHWNQKSAFVVGEFGLNYGYFYLAALSGILFWTQFARVFQPNRLFAAIGQNTLVIFPLHLLLFPFFTGVLVYLLKVPKQSIDHSSLCGFGYTVMAVLILLPVAGGLNCHLPFLLGRKPKNQHRQPQS